jgi:2-polyprenyl-3-methyl-5-hydroxy-6-metoxy-1,4-benzoquinol methylase
MPEPAIHSSAGDLLRGFWPEAGLPSERYLYYEFQARRYDGIADFLAPLGPWTDRRTLDLGGGVGGLAIVLRARLGGEYDLAEFAPPDEVHARALAHRGVERTYACDLSRRGGLTPLPSGYDAILLVEVLEHLLVNPLLLFREVWDHLAPGGLFFLTTPNMVRLPNRFRMLAGRSVKEQGRYPWDGTAVFGHVIEFTLDELDLLLRAECFERLATRVVQQIPTVRPTARQRLGVRLLNTAPARRLRLGDDLLVAYRKVPRPADGRCPVPLDGARRI